MKKIAIIGAGFSGLCLAHFLKDKAELSIFEKSRGVSGRMATRRIEQFSFDHGAQYFKARSHEFQQFLKPLLDQNIIARWDAKYGVFAGNSLLKRADWSLEEPRYAGVPSMNRVGKFLAEGLDVHLNTRIARLAKKDKWQLIDTDGEEYAGFDWVISAIPAPQAAELLPEACAFRTRVAEIRMLPCFAMMLGFEQALSLSFTAAHLQDSDISWIAQNSSKPGRDSLPSLVMHSSPEFAAKYREMREEAEKKLIHTTSQLIGFDVSVATTKSLHFWGYANNARRVPVELFIDQENHLAACGDWCQGGRVEGAFVSAYKLAQVLRQILGQKIP